ncbi:M20 aminoacylase family protein [Pseudomonas oleovorans]|uniref:M20 aminoacylase family protein n=3 Tax=Ectopseudomonas oleovorans TaxID=301 RepID=UPI0019CFD443|nr:M20 aminoacylase family protein [Pseudomonas oleovorans]MBN7119928.1 peptidase M20 [Pseudomonas oleovorans]MBN7133041.1 peptidase M20 [Pseudomonas oleovorans]
MDERKLSGNDAVATLVAWRHSLHRHPETAFEEHQTSKFVADTLRAHGLQVVTGLGRGTGVLAILDGKGGPGPAIGLRADMDALDVCEANSHNHVSSIPGKMHACGHDGHTTMLLGAACQLAQDPDFAGRVYFIFQPAEENEGGGRVMVEEGLFDQYPMDCVYALHNWPGLAAGEAAVHSTAVMASFDIFRLKLTGKGCHAAMPHLGKDAVLAACQLVTQLQSLVSRETPPHQSAVVSVTSFHAGDTYNVIPDSVELKGTLRCFDPALREQLEQRLRQAIEANASFYGLQAELDYQQRYPATINTPEHAERCAKVLESTPGITRVHRDMAPSMASEDFSFMLQKRPGAYIWLGNGSTSASLHNPNYDFNDKVLPIGVAYWQNLVKELGRLT